MKPTLHRSLVMKAALCAFAFIVTSSLASAHEIPKPCDFVTGGGFVKYSTGEHVNFGFNAGCKHHAFWGHVNVVDHKLHNLHMDSIQITGYTWTKVGTQRLRRDVCGTARTNLYGTVKFHMVVTDNGEPGRNDRFGLSLSNGYMLRTRALSGGNIQLHKPNPSTTPPSTFTECNNLAPDPGN